MAEENGADRLNKFIVDEAKITLESLVIPEVNTAQEAGELIYNLPNLWEQADTAQRRKIVQSMLDAVYI